MVRYKGLCITFPGRYELEHDISEYLKGGAMSILDLGCSVGVETSRLAAQYPRHTFLGIDAKEKLIDIAKSGIWSVHSDLVNYPDAWDENSYPDVFEFHRNPKRELQAFPATQEERVQEVLNKMQGKGERDMSETLELIGRPLPNLAFVAGDIDAMRFESDAYDLITAFDMGFDYDGGERLERFRVYLKPNGMLLTEGVKLRKA